MDEIKDDLPVKDIDAMEERRIERLQEAHIDEYDVLQKAREEWRLWDEYFSDNARRGKDDADFLFRDQWNMQERSEFMRLFKPAMTFNKLYDPYKKILGEQRKNKPDLLVRSLTGHASEEDIDLRSDLVRTISYNSQSELVYQAAASSALSYGYGGFQVIVDYETPRSFNKVVKLQIIPDITKCIFDATALKPHKGDGNFCSRQYLYSLEEFYATYPYITNPVSYSDPRSLLDFQMQTSDTIVVLDRFVKEWFPLKLYLLSNGKSVTEEEWKKMQKSLRKYKEISKNSPVVGDLIRNEIPKIIGERMTQDYKIMNYRLIHNQIIDFSEWPSKHLPIIFMDGDSCFMDGKQYTRSFIKEAKDAQRFVNYTGSEIASEIKNRRREQWIGTPDNIVGYDQIWRNPEQQMGILMAKPDPKTGQLPAKIAPWDLSPAMMQNFQRGSQDINEILGFSEAEELQGRDISGKARRERKLEGSMSAYVYSDNRNQAIEQGGRVILDLLPYIYSEQDRATIVTKQDGKTQTIYLNQHMPDGSIKNEITAGDYDIEIDTGPSFSVQKDIALEFLQQTLQTFPQAFPLVADLWAKNLDVQFMPQISERFKTLVPPQILAKEEGKPPPPPQPDPQQQMMQMEMQNQQQELQDRAHELQIRQQKHELEKIQLMMKAQELQEKTHTNRQDKAVELHKTNLDYSAKIAKVMADLKIANDNVVASAKKEKSAA
jgi:hypothetical protein